MKKRLLLLACLWAPLVSAAVDINKDVVIKFEPGEKAPLIHLTIRKELSQQEFLQSIPELRLATARAACRPGLGITSQYPEGLMMTVDDLSGHVSTGPVPPCETVGKS